jgi:hypothetical protein
MATIDCGAYANGRVVRVMETAWVQLKHRRSWIGSIAQSGSGTVQDHPSRLYKTGASCSRRVYRIGRQRTPRWERMREASGRRSHRASTMKARIVRHLTCQGVGHRSRHDSHRPIGVISDPHNLPKIGERLSVLIGRFGRHEQMDGSTIAALGRNVGHSHDRITRRALPQDEPRSRQPIRRC